MKKIVKIGSREVSIHGVTFKEIKEFAASCGEKAERILSVLEEEDFLNALNTALVSNLEEAEGFLEKYTDLTTEEIGELEVTDVVQLAKELLLVNGIDGKKVVPFFTGIARALREKEPKASDNGIRFREEVPEMS